MTRILHLSDTHVSASGIDMDGVDAAAALDRILFDARFVPEIDAVLVTGDIADDGSSAGCVAVRSRVERFSAGRGIPHLYTTGNHDARESFAHVLGSGHLAAGGQDLGRLLLPGSTTRAATSEVGGVRIVTLDSLVPGKAHGVLGGEQLDALADVLRTNAPAGTVLALHHPPLHLASIPHVARVVLQDIDALREVVAGSDVRVVLAGHLHFQLAGSLAGCPVWVTPGVVSRIDTTAPRHLVRGVLGASATVVELPDDGDPTFHVLHARDDRAGEQIYLYDAASGEDVTHEEAASGHDAATEPSA